MIPRGYSRVKGANTVEYPKLGAYGVSTACEYLDISRPTFYRLLASGLIPSFHIGRRRLVLKEHLDRYIRERLVDAGHASPGDEPGAIS